jgi:hypothetical protein
MLFWRAIQEGKQQGAEEFDLGRSEMDNSGLSVFKEHMGATCSKLVYFRYFRSGRLWSGIPTAGPRAQIMRTVFARLPDPFGRMVGAVLYRHMG